MRFLLTLLLRSDLSLHFLTPKIFKFSGFSEVWLNVTCIADLTAPEGSLLGKFVLNACILLYNIFAANLYEQ